MGMTSSRKRDGIIHMRLDRMSEDNTEATINKRVKKTNTPIEMFEIFTSMVPIFMK
jgi:hypothetical protein